MIELYNQSYLLFKYNPKLIDGRKEQEKRQNPIIYTQRVLGEMKLPRNIQQRKKIHINISHNFTFIYLVKMWKWIVLLMLWERVHSWCHSHNLNVGSKVQCLDYSPDGSKIVVGLESQNVRIYNSATGAQIGNYRRWGYKATTCRYSPDGTKIAVGYEHNDIKIVKGDSGYWEMYTVNTGHGKVYGVDFSSDSSKLLTCGDNGRFRVFNVQSSYSSTGGNFNIGQVVWSCRFTSDFSVAVGLDSGDVKIYGTSYTSPATSTYSPSQSSNAKAIALKSGSHDFVMAGANGKAYTNNSTSALLSEGNTMRAAAYSADGDYFMVGGEAQKVRVFESSSLTEVFNFTDPTDKITNAEFSDDSQYLAVGSDASKVYIYERCGANPSSAAVVINNSSNTTYCSPINISACARCINQTTCEQCVVGYYLTNTDTCELCVSVLDGCAICTSSSACATCLPGYWLNGTSCDKCSETIDGCILCNDSSTCLQCVSHYYVDAGTCSTCQSIINCIHCISQSECIECQLSYHVTNSGSCDPCADQCLFCNSTDCDACVSGYYLSSGICQVCVSPCLHCQDSTTCITCMSGYYINGTQCVQCQQTCDVCDDSGQCLKCMPSFYLNAGDCVRCQSTLPGCSYCTDSSTCSQCVTGYYEQAGTCSLCSAAMDGCLICDDASTCVVCEQQFYLSFSNCLSCASIQGCHLCSDSVTCTQCYPGYVLDTSSCAPCSDYLEGCLYCSSTAVCTTCFSAYQLQGSSCTPTTNAVNSNNSSSFSTCHLAQCTYCANNKCVQCQDGYYVANDICQQCESNCLKCTSTECLECESGYYYDGGNCSLCNNQSQGCIICDFTQCMGCKGGYYLSNDTCIRCDLLSDGCVLCENSTCLSCAPTHYLSSGSCLLCSSLSGCITCVSSSSCTSCMTGYYLETQQCHYCDDAMPGCLICASSSTCNKCMSAYTLDNNTHECTPTECNISDCARCSNNSCAECKSGYDEVNGGCQLCSSTLSHCIQCSLPACTKCQAGYTLHNDECQLCNDLLSGCILCDDTSTCTLCKSGYYLDGGTCNLCSSAIDGCIFCDGPSACTTCSAHYYHQGNVCQLCTTITGCTDCLSSSECLSCAGGYELISQQCVFIDEDDNEQQQQSDNQFVFKSFYVNKSMIKHVLYCEKEVKAGDGMDWQGVRIGNKGRNNEKLQIISVQWETYTITFYTQNDLDLEEKSNQMPFVRLLQSFQLSSVFSIQLSPAILNTLFPEETHNSTVSLDYSINEPEFYASYLHSASTTYYYFLFGYMITIILFINGLIQSCCFPSQKGHEIIGHIFALKMGALVFYPTFFQYISYCEGFMGADFPWINSIIGQVITNTSDISATPYLLFYINMNPASTYLLALLIYGVLLLIGIVVAYLGSSEAFWKERYLSYARFLYSFFLFGIIVMATAALQGAILNSLSQISQSSFFYGLGIIIGLICFAHCFYVLSSDTKNFWELRICLKAVFLSVASWSPFAILYLMITLDIILLILQFISNKKFQTHKILWLLSNLAVNSALILLLFVPHYILAIAVSSLLVCFVVCVEIYNHIQNGILKNRVKNQIAEQSMATIEDSSSLGEQIKNNIWDVKFAKKRNGKKKVVPEKTLIVDFSEAEENKKTNFSKKLSKE